MLTGALLMVLARGACAQQSVAPTPEQLAAERALQEQYAGYRGVDPDYLHAGPEALDHWLDLKFGLRICMGSYSIARLYAYDPNPANSKGGDWVIESLIDISAKGGNFMIITGPSSKGYFHSKAVEAIEYAGDWLKVNGEAIHKTRPFNVYHEGQHIRFTRSKDNRTVYAICLKWPGKQLTLKSVRAAEGSEIRLLGFEKPRQWRQDANGLVIEIPDALQSEAARPCKQAYSFRITAGQ